MSYRIAHNSVRSSVKTLIEDAVPILVEYDNHQLDPPEDAAWVSFRMLGGEGVATQLGSGSGVDTRQFGVAQFKVRVSINKGDKEALELADTIALAFQNTSVGTSPTVLLRTASMTNLGRVDDGRWWQVNVDIPYQFDGMVVESAAATTVLLVDNSSGDMLVTETPEYLAWE